MTQEDKQLLLADLCARLPYKCKYKASKEITHWYKLTLNTETIDKIINDYYDEINPYLRPMASMTEEEENELRRIRWTTKEGEPRMYEWCDYANAHHLDYRGLIEKGLALEAPEGMYVFNF